MATQKHPRGAFVYGKMFARMSPSKPFLLFDFDGVLFNSGSMVTHYVMTHWGHDEDQQKRNHEGNVYAREDGPRDVNDHVAEEAAITRFFRDYEQNMPTCALYPGIAEVIIAMAASQRYTFFVVSSTPSALITAVLERYGILQHFSGIYGMDIERSKTKKIAMIRERYGAAMQQCLFITDTLGDVREARHAGVEAIGVTWGVHERERLAKGSPWAIVDKLEDIPAVVDSYFMNK